MWKSLGILLLCSIVAVFFIREIAYVLHYLSFIHKELSSLLKKIFAGGALGRLIRDTASLFLLPVIIAFIPTGIYWAFTRKKFNYFSHVLWAAWLVIITTIALH